MDVTTVKNKVRIQRKLQTLCRLAIPVSWNEVQLVF